MQIISALPYLSVAVLGDPTCSLVTPQVCRSEQACVAAGGYWIAVTPAIYIPGTAVQGGRRYTLEQRDAEFTNTISAPDGGYCTHTSPAISQECASDATLCSSMDACMYRSQVAGRWFHSGSSDFCVPTCDHPLVFCDKSRCQATMGCSWFVKTQSNADQCFCIDNPGINGNPAARPKITWIYWDQPYAIPIFVFAVQGAAAVLFYAFVHNIKPFFERIFKQKPKE